MAATAEGAKTDEAKLNALLERQGAPREQRVALTGIFDRMRHVAMTRRLEGALEKLRANPDAADEEAEARAGGLPRLQVPTAVRTPDGLLELEGRVEGGGRMVQVRANGRWVFADDAGRFRVRLPVPAGASELTLEAADPAGARVAAAVRVESAADGTKRAPAAKPAGRRVALLIGVEEYDNAIPELETPLRDARAVAARLEKDYGFEARVLANPGKRELLEALRALTRELSEEDSLAVYYAGHGYLMQESGRGYWLPRDADTADPRNWISNRDVARLFHRTRAKQVFMISDSCYSGAFTREGLPQGAGPGAAAELQELRAVMALSSGGEQPVWDGGGDGHSVFAAQLMKALEEGRTPLGGALHAELYRSVTKVSPQVPGYGAMVSAGYDPGADYVLKGRAAGARGRP
jgi:hypothetical protein